MKRILIFSAIATMLFSLSGCAAHRPNVDSSGVDPKKYESDLKECQDYSKKFSPNKSQMALLAVGGGGLGAYAYREMADPEQKEAVKLHGQLTPGQYIESCIKAKGYIIIPDTNPRGSY
ncbi:MAG: hypothetical protein WCO89_03740 [Syntrophus sp. (in: bacteria)]